VSILERVGNSAVITKPAGALAYGLVFSPIVAKFLGKYGYALQTRMLGGDDMPFIDWGYEEDPPMGIPLPPEQEPHRYGIQLYHATASQWDIAGKKVLEVSCGHGGGAEYLATTMKPASYTGLDINAPGIEFCREHRRQPNLDFVCANAQELPFENDTFDAIINVEAGHLYADFNAFLREVNRVLKPGGHFLYADCRGQRDIPEWDATMAAFPLRKISGKAINKEICLGMDGSSVASLELLNTKIPAIFRGASSEFYCLPGSLMYRRTQSGHISYRMYHFIKD
jgi:SAM-dependent methyltransferase